MRSKRWCSGRRNISTARPTGNRWMRTMSGSGATVTEAAPHSSVMACLTQQRQFRNDPTISGIEGSLTRCDYLGKLEQKRCFVGLSKSNEFELN